MVNLIFRSSSTATVPTQTSVKNSPLTNLEVDGNFKSIQQGINTILDGSAQLNSTTLVGVPTAPTAPIGTNTTQVANTAFVISQIANDAPSLTGSYANPSWITSLASSKLTGTIVATNGVVTTGTYANPSWITSLSETKVLPTQTNNADKALVTNGTSTSWQTVQPSLTNDTSTDTTQYLGMTRSSSGSMTAAYVSSTKLYFNPSTGTLNSTIINSLTDIKVNGTTVIDSSRNITNVNTITTPIITGGKETRVAIAASNIDLATGNYFTKTISGATTFTVSNVPSAGTAVSLILDITNGGSAVVTWWSGVKWASGLAPTLTTSGRDIIGFFTHDGGTTWNGVMLGKGMA